MPGKIYLTAIFAILATAIGVTAALARPTSIVLDGFEDGNIKRPDGATYGWVLYYPEAHRSCNTPGDVDCENGNWWGINNFGANGTNKSLFVQVDETLTWKEMQIVYQPDNQNEYIPEAQGMNRLSIYVKFPLGFLNDFVTSKEPDSTYGVKLNMGTYHIDEDIPYDQESYNWHFYYYTIPDFRTDDGWAKFVINPLMTVERGFSGVGYTPGVNPTNGVGNIFDLMTKMYFAAPSTFSDITTAEVGTPYNIHFDELTFYYEDDEVTMTPEYWAVEQQVGTTQYYPLTVHNTGTVAKKYGIGRGNIARGGTNPTYSRAFIEDTNQNGVHDAGESTVISDTGYIQPGDSYTFFLEFTGDVTDVEYWINVVVYQMDPVTPGLDSRLWDRMYKPIYSFPTNVPPGTYSAGCNFRIKNITGTPTLAPPPVDAPTIAVSNIDENSFEVSWTSTGNGGLVIYDQGEPWPQWSYDLRYSTAIITEQNFSDATPITGETPAKRDSGTGQSWSSWPMLAADTTYYLAMAVIGNSGERSNISNVVSFSTTGQQQSNGYALPSLRFGGHPVKFTE